MLSITLVCLQFVYLKESFCPSLDEEVAVLYEVPILACIFRTVWLVGLQLCQ